MVDLIAGDTIVLKFPSSDILFLKDSAEVKATAVSPTNIGTVAIVDHYLTNEIYYIIELSTSLAKNPPPSRIFVTNLRNPGKSTNLPSNLNGLNIKMHYWHNTDTTLPQGAKKFYNSFTF